MSVQVLFTCGHGAKLGDTINASPRCVTCGCAEVARSVPSRLPRFTGTCTGPLAEFKALEPGVVNVASAGPLRLKEQA